MFILCLTVSLVVYYMYLYHFYMIARQRYPKGPIPLPFVGNLFSLHKTDPGKTLNQMANDRNGICTVFIPDPTVIITDYNMIKEALIDNAETFSDRPHREIAKFMFGDVLGISSARGDHWRRHRRFSLHVLRDFGFGRNLMEQKVNYEIDRLIEHLKTKTDRDVDVRPITQTCVSSIIGNVVFGESYNYESDKFLEKMVELFEKALSVLSHPITLLLNHFHFLQYVPVLNGFNAKVLKEVGEEMRQLFMPKIELSRLNTKTSEPETFCAAYWAEIQRRETAGEPDHGFHAEQLWMAVSDVWGAGMETTATTLEWTILFMCLHPNKQETVYQEILNQIGDGRISMADKVRLPYTTACAHEVQRVANIVPFNLPHATTKDVVISGHRIPKGTAVVPQISALHEDERFFENAMDFRPERFIENPQLVEKLNPFSMGKRACLGESLARVELFLIFANLVQTFKFELANISKNVSPYDRIVRFTSHPTDFKVVLTERSKL